MKLSSEQTVMQARAQRVHERAQAEAKTGPYSRLLKRWPDPRNFACACAIGDRDALESLRIAECSAPPEPKPTARPRAQRETYVADLSDIEPDKRMTKRERDAMEQRRKSLDRVGL